MRSASVLGLVALALLGAACRTAGTRPAGDRELAAKLRDLGVEGKTYANDLGQVANIRLGRVHMAGNDLLIEDIHGHLTYVDGATLNPRWDYYGLEQPFDKKPDFTPSAIVGIAGGKVFVINRANGTPEIEPRVLDVVPSGGPVATDSTLYVPTYATPSGNKTVYAINLVSGFQGWGWRTNSDVVGGLVKGGPDAGDQFYFATTDGVVYAFPTYPASTADPEMGWMTNLHGSVTNDLAHEGEDLGIVTNDARLVVLDRITGGVRWEAFPESSRETATGSASFSSSLVFYRCGGELRAFDRTTGERVFAVPHGLSFVAERGGRVLVMADGGRLVSLDRKSGKVIGVADVRGWTFPPRVQPDATIYAVSTHGAVMAVELGW